MTDWHGGIQKALVHNGASAESKANNELDRSGKSQRGVRPVLQCHHPEIHSRPFPASLRVAQSQAEHDQSVLSEIEAEIAIVEGAGSVEEVWSESQSQMLQPWQSVPEYKSKYTFFIIFFFFFFFFILLRCSSFYTFMSDKRVERRACQNFSRSWDIFPTLVEHSWKYIGKWPNYEWIKIQLIVILQYCKYCKIFIYLKYLKYLYIVK